MSTYVFWNNFTNRFRAVLILWRCNADQRGFCFLLSFVRFGSCVYDEQLKWNDDIKKEKKHHEVLNEYKEKVYTETMAKKDEFGNVHIYVEPDDDNYNAQD